MIADDDIPVKTLCILRASGTTQLYEKNNNHVETCVPWRFPACKTQSLNLPVFPDEENLLFYTTILVTCWLVLKRSSFLVTVKITALLNQPLLSFCRGSENGASYDQLPDSCSCLFRFPELIRQLLSRLIQSQRRRTGEGVFSGLMSALHLRNTLQFRKYRYCLISAQTERLLEMELFYCKFR